MDRSVLKWVGLTAAVACLGVGCAARAPRTPMNQPNPSYAGLGVQLPGSTTGDLDACATALGNVSAAGPTLGTTTNVPGDAVAANGVLLGNVAVVGLPTADQIPVTPPSGKGSISPAPTPTVSTTALGRIQTACRVAEVRSVINTSDRVRLAQIATALRQHQSLTPFIDDVVAISRRATSVYMAPAAAGTTITPGTTPYPGGAVPPTGGVVPPAGANMTRPGQTMQTPGTTVFPGATITAP
jgi:hypothetical protein